MESKNLFGLFFFYSVEMKGLMFGYATDETEECMPLTVVLAHRLNAKIAELRRAGEFWWARPDSKTQVHFPNNIIIVLIFNPKLFMMFTKT